MQMEIWKDIKGYQGRYQVSNFGRVKSLYFGGKKRQLIRKLKYRNYVEIPLDKNGKTKYYFVHRLVAEAFIPNPQNKQQVNHIDGNKHNNNINNLEWVTASENVWHRNYVLGYFRSDKFYEQYKKTSIVLKNLYIKKQHHVKDTKWMNKDGKVIRVKKEDIKKRLSEGYLFGRA